MARYTTEYGELIRTNFQPLLNCLATYPIQDESHRAELNEKILNRFKFREIGAETAARFVHYFKAQLFEIMPYYNRLFKVELDKIDPLVDADYTDSTIADTSGSTISQNSTGSKNVHGFSDTPQGGFPTSTFDAEQNFATSAEQEGTQSIEQFDTERTGYSKTQKDYTNETSTEFTLPKMLTGDNAYLSEASADVTTGANNSNTQSKTGANAFRTVRGKFPGMTYGTMLDDYKRAIWNIDRMILDDLEICFMGVY